MEFGVHLPQYGRAASAKMVERAARQAEDLGFRDVWVSDHLAVPSDAPYPPPFLYEPVITLAWAARATERVRLGTSVLVLPYRHPLHLAKELASVDQASGGRLLAGVAAGWLEREFDALGVPFAERGSRTDEAIDVLRACWGEQPVNHTGPHFTIRDMKVVPTPAGEVPLWVGGTSSHALRRAVEKGNGWHGNFVPPDDARPMVERLREARPEPSFTLSMRLTWDGLLTDPDEIRRDLDAYQELGIQHIMASPMQSDPDGWLRSVEALWDVFSRAS